MGPPSAPDRYRLRRSIGRGGEAVLYLADLELSGGAEPVVVKVLDTRRTMTEERFAGASADWSEQAELLRFLHRPGIVGVREHFEGAPPHPRGEAEDTPARALCLVMNHVKGLDLREWRAERTLGTATERREALRTLVQLAEVLDWLHSGRATPSGRVVVHGDLSPGNVMVDDDGQATLVDFGLSKVAPDRRTAEVWFTPGFAAPEVYEGLRSAAADRYAFGALAYFLLSGEDPPSSCEQLRNRLAQLPWIAELPAAQVGALQAVCDPDPQRRPDSLVTWVDRLRRGVLTTTSASPQPATAPAPARPSGPPLPPHPPTQPASAPAPAPAPAAAAVRAGQDGRRAGPSRRRALLGAAVAVPVVAAGTFWAVPFFGDDQDRANSRPPAATPTSTPLPTPTTSPSGASGTPSAEPDAEPDAGESAPAAEEPERLVMTVMEPVTGGRNFQGEGAVINTEKFTEAVTYRTTCHEGKATYHLGREWSSLAFTAGIEDTSDDTRMRLTVRGDDRVLTTSTLTLGASRKVKLDVSGVLRLHVEITPVYSTCDLVSDSVAALGDPTLTNP
ncbi:MULTISPECIES: protein kinase domain-containing protein [unclassified Streptomyces]|uniref:protein kinase domain-containing protein n=1 Tax=unclassified Streptomyces TaxID=2593676 RepID=UPI0021C83660|nr:MULTISPECIES: protein kinase [unclassified Streptomyces]WSQ77488.1 protein kinase [Streptomyces sp. NBC_01213]WSQ84848.1 protein kinase [Streptomyces sp. NBC_01212]WSR09069.1 protein kinase [Streptomyces sp. NBC_01208]